MKSKKFHCLTLKKKNIYMSKIMHIIKKKKNAKAQSAYKKLNEELMVVT